ncbi:MAG: hypothetical protein R2773_07145 [Flavobacteriaceae bacterium]
MLSDFKPVLLEKRMNWKSPGSAFQGLHSRVIIVLDENNTVLLYEQVSEIKIEPDYEKTLKALK